MTTRSPAPKINSRTARNRLPSRSAPYWHGLPGGWAVGYRKRRDAASTWLCRVPIGDKKYEWHTIGKADDDEPSDGQKFFNFDEAVEAGRVWLACREAAALARASAETAATGPVPMLVDLACDNYLTWYATQRKAVATARSHLKVLFEPKFKGRDVTSLKVTELRAWLDDLSRAGRMVRQRKLASPDAPRNRLAPPETEEEIRQRRSTANRVLNTIKAMLNRTVDEWDATTNGPAPLARPWNAVQSFLEADVARLRFLDRGEARALVAASEPDFADLVHGALLSGARYGILCRFLVKDFAAGKLHVVKSKGTTEYWISLSAEGRAFFQKLTEGRHPDKNMFLRRDGEPWRPCNQARPMDDACVAAQIDRCTFHELRHTYASLALMNDPPIPMQVLAANLGHKDTRMVEKHYGHLLRSYHDEMVEKSAPRFGIDDASNVVSLKRS